MVHYKEHLDNKVIYLPCDEPNKSEFYNYFLKNFDLYNLKKIISTYKNHKKSYKTEIFKVDGKIVISKEKLKGDGDFRSDECLNIFSECDVVITNPPFSLYIALIDIIFYFKKDFILIGSMHSYSYRSVFYKAKTGKIKCGYGGIKTRLSFYCYKEKKDIVLPIAQFFTSFEIEDFRADLHLTKKYSEKDYEKYYNYDAVNIDNIKDIPIDYNGLLGVPISIFQTKYEKEFEIVNISTFIKKYTKFKSSCIYVNGDNRKYLPNVKNELYIKKTAKDDRYFILDNGVELKSVFKRVFIKRKGG